VVGKHGRGYKSAQRDLQLSGANASARGMVDLHFADALAQALSRLDYHFHTN
jgi:hypothetical protein